MGADHAAATRRTRTFIRFVRARPQRPVRRLSQLAMAAGTLVAQGAPRSRIPGLHATHRNGRVLEALRLAGPLQARGHPRCAGIRLPMNARPSVFAELKRRNVFRACVLYAGTVWALAQGLAQLLPLFGNYEWIARWFVVAGVVGFPFWIAFAWFYEFTPQGLKRESEIAADASIVRSTGRAMDKWIIAVLVIAVVLLLTNTFVWRKGEGLDGGSVSGAPAKSIAVLPLVNESGDVRQDYFSDGLSEELISALGQVRALKVIGRNSSFQFRGRAQDDTAGIGAKLGVATLLEGTVRKQGDEVRIV